MSVDKIEPQKLGSYDAVIAGAGHADLVDGFAESLADQIETWEASLTESELKSKIRSVVLDYHRNEVAVCPAEDKDIEFVVCLKDRSEITANVYLWTIRTTAVKRVKKYAVIGWEEGIYRHDIDRHYKENEKTLFSMLVGIHVLLLAEKTSNNIGGPTKIVVAAPIGFRAIAAEDVAELDRRVSEFDSVIDRLRLRICDTTIPLDDFSANVSDFQTAIMNLRLTLTDDIILAKLGRLKDVIGSLKTEEDLLSLYDPYLGLPTLKESRRALRAAWDSVTANRRSRRDLAIASNTLAHACGLVTKMISPAYKAGAITLEQRREFATRLHKINEAGKANLDELRECNSDSVLDAQDIYARLTEQVVDPLLAVADDFSKLFETSNEQANQFVQGIHAVFLSLFTTGFVSPFSKEPESLPTPKVTETRQIEGEKT